MPMLYDDTIVALATPPGEGGLGVIRLSGPQALAIADRMFRPQRPGPWRSYRLRYGQLLARDGALLDTVLAAFMRAPQSYTAEDVVEFSCHGGPLIIGRVLEEALAHGARRAEPGEFTMRAFLHGRIDLTQAEATLDIITARTTTGLALAQAQLGGWFAQELRRIRQCVLEPLAYLTAQIDFPEDEIDAQQVVPPLDTARAALARLRSSADQGIVYRQGARAALVGLPNAGKSSLLNALLRIDRAIVTPIPGTTRDTLEETASLAGVPVLLIDTAGITESDDPVEQIGVARSRAALAGADLALLLVDSTIPLPPQSLLIAELTRAKPTILVLTKQDLVQCPLPTRELAQLEEAHGGAFATIVPTSSQTGMGLDELAQAVATQLLGHVAASGSQLVTNPRHRDALQRADMLLAQALTGLEQQLPLELVVADLGGAVSAIGEITGEDAGEDLLRTIFSRFCIGK